VNVVVKKYIESFGDEKVFFRREGENIPYKIL
jgi:hypothetical protein